MLCSIVTLFFEDEEKYEDILEDIHIECYTYGVVRSLETLRLIKGIDVPESGKIIDKFIL